jgi:hypothetical protein
MRFSFHAIVYLVYLHSQRNYKICILVIFLLYSISIHSEQMEFFRLSKKVGLKLLSSEMDLAVSGII